MALNANVQKLVDDVAKNSDLSKSILAAQDLQAQQIADLKTQLASIQPGQPIDDENLTAINNMVSTIEQTNTALGTAVPASTPAGPPITPVNPNAPLTNGTQPVTSDSAGNPIAPDAPGQPGVPVQGQTPVPTPPPIGTVVPQPTSTTPAPGDQPPPDTITTTSAVTPTFVPDPGTPSTTPSA